MPTTINQLQAPMEMLGVHQGITVIDPATILTRLWYFDGKFLRAEGFRTDQQYVRSLVALSNQAAGHGVVHGFDARLGSGDTIDVDGGLAVAPSGRIVYLPQGTGLDVAKLIARASGDFDPAQAAGAGTADFGLCPPDAPTGPDQSVSPSTIWVLTVAAAEALCGEEERFGQLCEDACATETDRSVAVEGVCFRVHPLSLNLPTASTVHLDGLHLRSQVASAYFEAERQAVISGISGAGLRSALWCHGADGVGGEEIPLGVFNRAGAVTSWLDMWTARREVMETSPQRYWGWRFAMRPLDVFLAQVLQFQCQLSVLGTNTPGTGGDPCADERIALETASATLSALLTPKDPQPGEIIADVVGPPNLIPIKAAAELTQLNALIANALTGKVTSTSGSALIDGGIVELPSGGYLPVDPDKDVTSQVRAFMGSGVDLRFCAVRPDFIPEALQEAQHMERISLTQGIDDPDNLEEVDILVPGGTFEQTARETSAFEGTIRVLPNLQGENEPLIELPTFAREHTEQGWSWTSIVYLGIGDQFDPSNVIKVVGGTASTKKQTAAADAPVVEAEIAEAIRDLRTVEGGPRLFVAETERRVALGRQLMARELLADRNARRLRADGLLGVNARDTVRLRQPTAEDTLARVPDAGNGALFGWLDLAIDADLRTVNPGTRVPFRMQAIAYVNAVQDEFFADFTLNGGLTVTSVTPTGLGNGTRVSTMLDGGVDYLIDRPGDIDTGFEIASGLEIDWLIGDEGPSKGVRLTAVRDTGPGKGDRMVQATFASTGINRLIKGSLSILGPAETHVGTIELAQLADMRLTENDGVLDSGTVGRDIGESLISVLTAELAERERLGVFATRAPQRLFGTPGGSTSTISATADWVMFHRRRNKVCADETVTAPTRLRRYRWFHSEIEDPVITNELFVGLSPKASGIERARAFEQAEFSLVAEVEFAEGTSELRTPGPVLRNGFQNATNSTTIGAGLVAEPSSGEGPALARTRLNNTLGAISNLASSTGAKIEWISPVPPEHQATGIDGVFYTFGQRPKEETTLATAVMVRTPTALVSALDQLDGTVTKDELSAVFEEFGSQLDFHSAEFVDNSISNAEEMKAWWATDQPVAMARVAFSPDLAPSNEQLRKLWATDRSEAISSTLGTNSVSAGLIENVSVSLADGEAVFFLF